MVPHPPFDRRFAKRMRFDPTDAERKLWTMLRGGRLDGLKFKRQVPIDGYIVDFVCFDARLIVEADGGQHEGSKGDALRDRHFEEQGFRTLRFWNADIFANPDGVWLTIEEAVRR